jgi:hypothetical protein
MTKRKFEIMYKGELIEIGKAMLERENTGKRAFRD